MRCAITGFGIVSSLGVGVPAFRQALRSGQRHLSWLHDMPLPHGKGNFAMSDFPESVDRSVQMSLCAIEEAVEMSSAVWRGGHDAGLVIGSVWADTQSAESAYVQLKRGETAPALTAALQYYPAGSLADAIGDSLDIRGPRLIFNNACASSNIALGYALDMLRQGVCRVVVAVGVDRFSLPGLWGAERSGFVGRHLQPFDRDRMGTVLGEGSAVMILEVDDEAATKRAKAWFEGYACICEPGAADITLAEDGIGLQMSMLGALGDAGCGVEDVDYVNAHSPGTPKIDLLECRAIGALWKNCPQTPAVNATKALTGHMSGASAVAEAIATVIQIQDGFIHGNVGLQNVDPKIPVKVQGPLSEDRKVDRAISNACGGGGLNTSVVLSSPATGRLKTSTNSSSSRVVITGSSSLQAPAPAQDEEEACWFDIHRWLGPETHITDMNRCAWIGSTAGAMAIAAAGLNSCSPHLPLEQVAVVGGFWLGGWPAASTALCEGLLRSPVEIFPSTALNNFGAYLASMMLCRVFGFTGPTHTVCGSIASGLQAVAVAHTLLERGRAKAAVVIAGDSDDQWLRRAAHWFPDSSLLSNFREGGASLVLETEATAARRGAPALASISSKAVLSGPLHCSQDLEKASETLLRLLNPTLLDRIVLAGPADVGIQALASLIQQKTGVPLELPEQTHSLAGSGVMALASHLRGRNVLLLGGASCSSQVGLLLSGSG